MNHMEFAASESAADEPTGFEVWADKAEKAFGRDLDGDEATDGYSVDGAYTAFLRGDTVAQYVSTLPA